MNPLPKRLLHHVGAVAAAAFWAVLPAAAIDAPANPNASPEVRALLSYMESIHGSKILSGQQEFPSWPWNDADEDDIEYVHRVTGKWPAVRGFDFLFYTHSAGGRAAMQVTERAIAWAQQGGIVTFCVHFFVDVGSPAGNPQFYTPGANGNAVGTNFDIRQAIISGTPENTEFVTKMDVLATELKKLRDAKVPVIWRPFHEEGGTWFWWSRYGAAPFITAWRMMYDRFTTMHGLNNLIWEFNPNDLSILTAWYPGDAYVDMISLDVYPGSGHPVFATEYNQYRNFTNGRKLVALSENGRMPDPDQLAAQNAHWLYFCTWNGDFITSNTYNDLAFKQAIFNHDRVLTRDELPKVYLWNRAPQFTQQPASQVVDAGANIALTATADANETFTYQWYRNGAAISGATAASLNLTNLQAADAGAYTVLATSSLGTTSSNASAIVVGPRTGRLLNLSTRGPVRTNSEIMIAGFVLGGSTPRTVLIRGVGPELARFGVGGLLANPQITVYSGQTSILSNDNWSVQTSGGPAVAPVAASVSAFDLAAGSLDAALVATLNPGLYTVHVTGANAGTGVALAEMYDVSGDNNTSRLLNLSTRGYVSTGASIMIPGIVVNEAGRKLLVRGIGPGLAGAGLSPLLPDPVMRVVDPAGNEIFSNDNWGSVASAPETAAAMSATSAFSIPDGSLDAARVVILPPGQFTVLVSDKNSQSGIAIVEVYEMAP
jgi:mannan endo-1,4-beta-mannosidase